MTADRRLALVLIVNLAMIAALVTVGLLARSLGVLASGVDYLGDAAGVAISIAALRISRRQHGHPRAPSLAAGANGTFLLAVTVWVAVEAVKRLTTHTPHVEGLPVLLVSALAAVAMVACALVLGPIEKEDLNMRSVMLDTLADAGAGTGVALSGAIILATGSLYWLDSAVALAIAIVVAYHAVRLLADVVAMLRGRAA